MDLFTVIGIVIAIGVVLCGCLAIATYSYSGFVDKLEKYDSIKVMEDIVPMQFAQHLNQTRFEGKIKFGAIKGRGTDCYVSKTKTMYLSETSRGGNGLASFAIIAHEFGHAQQDSEGKLKVSHFLRKFGRLIGPLLFPLIIAGVIMLFFGSDYYIYAYCLIGGGVAIFLLSIVIKAMSVSIESDASRRAIVFLQEFLSEKEVKMCKKLLNSAKLTYWGDMFRAMFGWTMFTGKTKLFK